MPRDDANMHARMNRALDSELSEEEQALLHQQLEEAPEIADHWDQLRRTDELLRTTPMIAPLPEFASRVMAAISALPIPAFVRRHPGAGVALGLALAAFLTVPIFSVLLLVLLSALTDPGTLNTWLRAVLGASGYILALVADIADELRAGITTTPMIVALITTMIPLSALWGWLIWYLMGSPRVRRGAKP
ncbi:MAG: hypothetical protein HY866_00275 [Chloroflexi bacterium]|nr:hypothetical protein [Chloroflexota bacterium]